MVVRCQRRLNLWKTGDTSRDKHFNYLFRKGYTAFCQVHGVIVELLPHSYRQIL